MLGSTSDQWNFYVLARSLLGLVMALCVFNLGRTYEVYARGITLFKKSTTET
jgi:hypothetical protein